MARGSILERKLATGRTVYDCKFRERDGRQRLKRGFDRKKDAEAWLNRTLADLHEGKYAAPAARGTTVADLTRAWLAEKVLEERNGSLKASTLRGYEQIANKRIIAKLGSIHANKLTREAVASFYAELQEADWLPEKRALSARSVQQTHVVLHAILKHAQVETRVLSRNVAAELSSSKKVPRPRRQKFNRIDGAWTAEEASKFLQGCSEHPLAAAFRLALSTGLRRGELAGLRWSRVDFDRQRLTIDTTRLELGGKIRTDTPKNHQLRVIKLAPADVVALKGLQREQREHFLRLGYRPAAGEDWIFTDAAATPYRPDQISRAFHAECERLGIRRIRFHALRHTAVSLLLEQGVRPQVVQERMGHHSAAFTQDVYGHLFEDAQDAAVDAVSRVLDGPT